MTMASAYTRAARSETVRDAGAPDTTTLPVEEQAVRAGTPFVARVDRESRAREGARVAIAVDTRQLHFFELETGAAILAR